MIRYEDDCVGCDAHCDSSCRYYEKQPHIYCDRCGDEGEEVYDVEGEHVCKECLCQMCGICHDAPGTEENEEELCEKYSEVTP